MIFLSFSIILAFHATQTRTVKIKSLRVPDTVVMNSSANTTSLPLECNYDLNPKENGLVVKWYFNDQQVYQWIANRQPSIIGSFKGLVDVNSTSTKGFTLREINKNITGTYKCNVQTFESTDEKETHLQVMIPEKNFEMDQIISNKFVLIRCSADNVYPEPKLFIMLGADYLIDQSKRIKHNPDETYNVSILAKVHKRSISKHPIVISCILSIPQTTYIKKKEAIYYNTDADNFFDDDTYNFLDSQLFSQGISSAKLSATKSCNKFVSLLTLWMLTQTFYYC